MRVLHETLVLPWAGSSTCSLTSHQPVLGMSLSVSADLWRLSCAPARSAPEGLVYPSATTRQWSRILYDLYRLSACKLHARRWSSAMPLLQILDVPDPLHRLLQRRAMLNKRSLGQQALVDPQVLTGGDPRQPARTPWSGILKTCVVLSR